MPDTSNPDKAATKTETTFAVAELSDAEYNELSDEFMHDLLERFETHQDNGAPIDVEYSVSLIPLQLSHELTNHLPPVWCHDRHCS
jgi:frataxin